MRTRLGGASAILLCLSLPGRPAAAQEPVDSTALDTVVYAGTFRSVAGHQAGGDFQVVRRGNQWVVKMMANFTTEKVPDGHVYFSDQPEQLTRGAVHVGRLYQREGAHEYPLPDGLDPTAFKYLLVWCVRFDVGVAAGTLET